MVAVAVSKRRRNFWPPSISTSCISFPRSLSSSGRSSMPITTEWVTSISKPELSSFTLRWLPILLRNPIRWEGRSPFPRLHRRQSSKSVLLIQFRPTNFNFLMLSRFRFSPRKDGFKSRSGRRFCRSGSSWRSQWIGLRIKRSMESRTTQKGMPGTIELVDGLCEVVKEKIEHWVHQEEMLNQQVIELGRTRPSRLEYVSFNLWSREQAAQTGV